MQHQHRAAMSNPRPRGKERVACPGGGAGRVRGRPCVSSREPDHFPRGAGGRARSVMPPRCKWARRTSHGRGGVVMLHSTEALRVAIDLRTHGKRTNNGNRKAPAEPSVEARGAHADAPSCAA